ncbi:hypothetical protein UlMin_016908 [Ulmus minor]
MNLRLLGTIHKNDITALSSLVLNDQGLLEQRKEKSMNTVLHLAAKFAHVDMVSNIITLTWKTPFHEAACVGNPKILKLLLKINSKKKSALYMACSYGHVDAVRLLLSQPGVPSPGEGESDQTCIHVATSGGHTEHNGNSPLHYASIYKHREITTTLLKLEPKLAQKYNSGYTPLHYATMNIKFPVLIICVNGCNIFPVSHKRGFHLAVKHGQYDALVSMIHFCNGMDLFTCQDRNGNTILHLAVSEGKYQRSVARSVPLLDNIPQRSLFAKEYEMHTVSKPSSWQHSSSSMSSPSSKSPSGLSSPQSRRSSCFPSPQVQVERRSMGIQNPESLSLSNCWIGITMNMKIKHSMFMELHSGSKLGLINVPYLFDEGSDHKIHKLF